MIFEYRSNEYLIKREIVQVNYLNVNKIKDKKDICFYCSKLKEKTSVGLGSPQKNDSPMVPVKV